MVHRHNIISMILPVAVAGILVMAILANQAFASNYYDSKRGHNDGTYYKSSYTAQESSNNGQGASGSKADQCKSAITQLSALYYAPYRNWRIHGELTCGGTGLSGKTIILTKSNLSYVGKLGTAVTGATGGGGNFVTWVDQWWKGQPTATTAKPGSTLSAWYLGGPDEGGIASKTITLPLLTAEQTFANLHHKRL